MPNKNKIGEKIKTLMEVRNVSLEELANDSDVNIELVEKILNGGNYTISYSFNQNS